jgi:hypothetical protein
LANDAAENQVRVQRHVRDLNKKIRTAVLGNGDVSFWRAAKSERVKNACAFTSATSVSAMDGEALASTPICSAGCGSASWLMHSSAAGTQQTSEMLPTPAPSKAKPAWALTEDHALQRQDAEDSKLLDFVENLDLDAFFANFDKKDNVPVKLELQVRSLCIFGPCSACVMQSFEKLRNSLALNHQERARCMYH